MPPLRSLVSLLPLATCLCLALAQCPRWQGTYRDCTCGVRYRDEEQRCCNGDTCLQPELVSRNRTCPFQCQNGGVFDSNLRQCTCQRGFFGLCCERETEECGGTHVAPVGMLSSPGYPDPYSNKLHCVWRISTDPIRRIALGNAGDLFELEQGTTQDSCNHDWLAVYDGSSQKSRLIGRYCGNTMPTVRSSGRHLLVEFSTDWQQRRRGFQLHYITFFAVELCGRTQFSRQTGIILSPHYPLAYPPHVSCSYHIRVRPRHVLVLSTEELAVPARHNCHSGDRIIVSRHQHEDQGLKSLFVLCGSSLFQPIFITDSSRVTLDFSSNCHTSRQPSEGRFKLRFEQIPSFA